MSQQRVRQYGTSLPLGCTERPSMKLLTYPWGKEQ